jgi:hypothetical protein
MSRDGCTPERKLNGNHGERDSVRLVTAAIALGGLVVRADVASAITRSAPVVSGTSNRPETTGLFTSHK